MAELSQLGHFALEVALFGWNISIKSYAFCVRNALLKQKTSNNGGLWVLRDSVLHP